MTIEQRIHSQDAVVIVAAARTPIGAFQGELAALTAPQLGAIAINAAIDRAGIDRQLIDEAYLGNVLSAGVGQAPARQAVLGAGLPTHIVCTTVSKVCGSGMKAIMLAHDAIVAGTSRIVMAGGMESMSNAPYLLPKGRSGYRLGHGQLLDHMMLDGLEDAYDIAPDGTRRSMGTFGEDCAAKYRLTRAQQDQFAAESVTRAIQADRAGCFDWEMAPVTMTTKSGAVHITQDEGPRRSRIEKISSLKPAFRQDGTITAASASSINDGAAALLLMRQSTAAAFGLTALARIVGQSTYAGAPNWFTTAPVMAIERLYQKTGWTTQSVDLFEINEAFAVVPMAVMMEHGIARDRVNIHGGACALGHPIGCSGARIVVTLLGAMRQQHARRGIATLCIGGGEATAIAIELI